MILMTNHLIIMGKNGRKWTAKTVLTRSNAKQQLYNQTKLAILLRMHNSNPFESVYAGSEYQRLNFAVIFLSGVALFNTIYDSLGLAVVSRVQCIL